MTETIELTQNRIKELFDYREDGALIRRINGVKTNNLLSVTVCGGKYTVIQNRNGALRALRYGEEWRDCLGDGLVLGLAQEVAELRQKIEEAKNCLVCAAIAPAIEVVENTLEILNKETE